MKWRTQHQGFAVERHAQSSPVGQYFDRLQGRDNKIAVGFEAAEESSYRKLQEGEAASSFDHVQAEVAAIQPRAAADGEPIQPVHVIGDEEAGCPALSLPTRRKDADPRSWEPPQHATHSERRPEPPSGAIPVVSLALGH